MKVLGVYLGEEKARGRGGGGEFWIPQLVDYYVDSRNITRSISGFPKASGESYIVRTLGDVKPFLESPVCCSFPLDLYHDISLF